MEESNRELSDVERYEIELFSVVLPTSAGLMGWLSLSFLFPFASIAILLGAEPILVGTMPSPAAYIPAGVALVLSLIFLRMFGRAGAGSREFVISSNLLKITDERTSLLLVRSTVIAISRVGEQLILMTHTGGAVAMPTAPELQPLRDRILRWAPGPVAQRSLIVWNLGALIGIPTGAFAAAASGVSIPHLRLGFVVLLAAMVVWWAVDIAYAPARRGMKVTLLLSAVVYSAFVGAALSRL